MNQALIAYYVNSSLSVAIVGREQAKQVLEC